ncbi:MAG: MFS transporter [Solobacterium sp.]|nr:MFS transporter [Solobacterium sp.]
MNKMMKLFDQYRGLRKEIYILFFGRVVTNLGSMIWPVMTMILSQKLGLSAAEISYFFVGASLIILPANIIGGKLADRYNKKWVIVACDTVSIFCFFVSAAVPLGLGTIFLFVLAGALQSVEYPSYEALFADLSTTNDRDRAFSLEYLGGNLGLILSPTIAGLLFQNYLWLSFLISGISIACSTILIAVFIKDITPVEDTGEKAVYQEKKDDVSVLGVLRENPLLLLFLVCGALYNAAYMQYTYIMPLDMASVHGENGAFLFGTVTSLNCITVVLFTPIITKVFSNMRDAGKMITGRILIFAGYLVFLLFLGFVPSYYLAMLIFTWGEIFSAISEGPYVSVRIPASHRGRVNGIMSVVYTIFLILVELSVGQIYDRAGSHWTWVFIMTVVLISILLAVLLKTKDRKAYPKLYEEGKENFEDA